MRYGMGPNGPVVVYEPKLILKVFLHEGGMLPARGKEGDAGLDVFACLPIEERGNEFGERGTFVRYGADKTTKIPLGFSYSFWLKDEWDVEHLSHDFFLDIRNRSGIGTKEGLVTVAEVGDANYRGIIHYCVAKVTQGLTHITHEMKVAQALINPFIDPHKVEIRQVETIEQLGPSSRGAKGFGASGNS